MIEKIQACLSDQKELAIFVGYTQLIFSSAILGRNIHFTTNM